MESLNTTTIYGDLLNTTTYDFILNNDSEISFNSVVCSPEPIAVNATELTGLGKFNEAYAGVHGYLSVMVCLFGMVANSVNIVVLTRKNMLSSTNVLLTWLAVADLFTMLSYFPFALHFFIFKGPDLFYFTTRYFGWICFLLFHASFSIVCHTVAIWITIALAIFRFLYIWFPTRGATYCSLARAKLAITVTIVSTIACLVPNYIINVNGTMQICDPKTNTYETIHTIEYRSGKEFRVLENVNYWVQAIFVKLIPCIMLTILTVLLIVAMHRAYKKRMALKNQGKKDESDKHNEHNRTTLMLFTVVVLFLITEFPQGVLTLMSSLNKAYHREIYENLGNLLDMMALLNNSINFVLYCTMSRQFRHTFISIFCKCCPENRPGWRKMGVVSSEKNGFATVTTHV